MGVDPVAAIERHGERIDVQLSDCPGRGAPGTGALAVWEILERLHARGYAGTAGLEYETAGRTEDSLAFMLILARCRSRRAFAHRSLDMRS